jgi:protein tyrosine phosphatase
MILGFTMAFLIVAALVLAYHRFKLSNADFDVLPLPATSSTGGVKRDSTMTDKRAGSILFQSEEAPTADNFVVCRLPFNVMKNRFQQHLPYDHTRIELAESNGAPGSDYINASHIPGHKETTYIAAQAPLSCTVQDFWRMVCEQGCTIIVMMTLAREDGVEHSYQYWPHLTGEEHSITFGDITVTTTALDLTEEYAVRTISVSIGERPKYINRKYASTHFTLTHCLFFGLNDKSTPANTRSFRSFREKVKTTTKDNTGPVLVHCNNGSGRTGVYVCYDMTMARYENSGEADIFETLVTIRRHRPQMVESKAQYLFLHRAFLDQLLEGPLQILGNPNAPQEAFLRSLAVPNDLAPFDIGVSGRKILHLGDLQLVNSTEGQWAAATLAITSDLVLLCSLQNGQQVLQGFADRKVVAESLFEKIPRADPLCFGVVMDQLYVLAASDVSSKADWVRRLANTDSYVPPEKLSGERMTSFRPTSRSAALAILQCADPQVESGAIALKKEYDTVPRAFSVGPRTVVKGTKTTQGKTGYLSNPLGPKTANNPIAGAPGGDSSIFFGSPAKLNLNETYIGRPPPAMADLLMSQEPPAYANGHVGRPTAISMGGKILFPELVQKAAVNTEAQIATKLSELETAIQRADELNLIATRGEGHYVTESVIKAPRTAPARAMRAPDEAQTGASIAVTADFSNAHRAQLWEMFHEVENVTNSINVDELKALLVEFGLLPEQNGEKLLLQTLKAIGPMIEVDDFEVTFLARQRLHAGNFKRGVPVSNSSTNQARRTSIGGPWFSDELRHHLHELFGEEKPHGVEHRFEFDTLVNILHSAGVLNQIEVDSGDGKSGLLALCKSMPRDGNGRMRVVDFEQKFMAAAGRSRQSSRPDSPVRIASPVRMARRVSADSTLDVYSLTSTPKKDTLQSYIETENNQQDGNFRLKGSKGRQAADPTADEPSTATTELNSGISRQDLVAAPAIRHMDSHHVEHVLGQRGISIPALALKSLHTHRVKGGYTDADDVFTIHKGAKKRMVRNPTMRAKGTSANYKVRNSILDQCTFLGNCTCGKCDAAHAENSAV